MSAKGKKKTSLSTMLIYLCIVLAVLYCIAAVGLAFDKSKDENGKIDFGGELMTNVESSFADYEGIFENIGDEETYCSKLTFFGAMFIGIYDLTVEGGQECPTADCKLREIPPGYCGGQCSPNDDGSPGVCPGHYAPPQPYCDHSHVKAVIVIQEVPRGVIENDVLMLTEEEKNMIAIALELLSDIQP